MKYLKKARKILANNIVYYRLKKGLSQEDLADFKEKFIKHIKKNGFEIIE